MRNTKNFKWRTWFFLQSLRNFSNKVSEFNFDVQFGENSVRLTLDESVSFGLKKNLLKNFNMSSKLNRDETKTFELERKN